MGDQNIFGSLSTRAAHSRGGLVTFVLIQK